MPKPMAGIFIHISKFQRESLLNYLQEIQNWYDNQKSPKNLYISFPIFFWKEIIKNDLLHFWIKKMIQEKSIIYCPNTFSGENHQTLDFKEIEYDLSSTLSNSEKIGYLDLFSQQPTFVYISNRDLYREKIQNIYRNYQKLIFIESLRKDEKNQLYLLFWKGNKRKYVNIHSNSIKSKTKEFFKCFIPFFSQKKLFFWSSITRKESLSSFLNSLNKEYFTNTKLEDLLQPAKGYMTHRYAFIAEENIEILNHCYIRQQKSVIYNEKELRENITNFFPIYSSKPSSIATDPQQIWEGDFSLYSKNFKLNFNRGQLISFSNKNKSNYFIGKTKSYWRTPKNLREFLYRSFSITQENNSGLRQIISSFEDNNLSYLDFFPIENQSMFLINVNLNWSHKFLSSSDSIFFCPIEITLCEIPSNSYLKVTIFNSHNSKYELYIHDDFHEETLWGEIFSFDNYKTSIVIAFISSDDLCIKHPIALKVTKKRGLFYLILKIEQSYYCNNNKNSLSQQFSFAICQPDQTPLAFPSFSDSIKKKAYRNQITTNEVF